MAGRNVKRGLMYFRLDCDLFQDRKLKRLMRRWQNDGLAVYLALLCEIYRDKGYYIVADKDLIADIADTCLLDDDRTSNIFRGRCHQGQRHQGPQAREPSGSAPVCVGGRHAPRAERSGHRRALDFERHHDRRQGP